MEHFWYTYTHNDLKSGYSKLLSMRTIVTLLFLILPLVGLLAQQTTPLSEAEFEVHRAQIAGQSFDSKRLLKAKELSDVQYLYVSQIEAIIKGFSLESNKLEYAKYAYSTTLDAANYPNLVALFRLSESKEALKGFLSKREIPVVPQASEKTVTIEESASDNESSAVEITTGPKPIDDPSFAAAKRSVSEESFESAKLRRAKQISDANYLLAGQVKELLDLLSFESSKLEYAQYAYDKTYDQANYEIVKEGLKHSKSKETMRAFLKNKPVTTYQQKKEVVKANLTPVANTQTPNTPSTIVMSQGDFINAQNQITSQTSDSKKLEEAKAIANKNNLSSEQIKSIVGIFLFEDNRLEFAKYAYAKTVDQENYDLVKAALEKENHKFLEDYIKHVDKKMAENTLATGPSELSSEDFEALKHKLKGLALESHKLERAKIIVDRSKISAMQVKQINDLFELEETRLDFAQYAYSKTLNPQDYSIVREALTKTTSKYALDRFIKAQKK